MNIQRVLGAICALAIGITAFTTAVHAQSGSSVLRVARGAASQDITVAVNRAIVLEATQVFAEVSVANPGIADVAALSNQTIYILGKNSGRTTLTLLGEGGKLIANVTIRVAPDLAEFKSRLQEILPGERVEVRTANDGIVLSGTLSGARKLSRALELANRYAPGRVTNMMSVGGTQQVMLKVRFAEVSRNAVKSLGVNLGAILDTSDVGATGQTGAFTTQFDGIGGGPVTVSQGAFGIGSVFFTVGALTLDLVIDALESKGFARTLAEPTLVALSGDTASFLAGGEVPVPVRNEDGISVEYKDFGISLGFTPTVVDDDLINIQLVAESSQLGEQTDLGAETAVFEFVTRRARTTVELRDGQSFAIAGLLQENFSDGISQVPWLGEVPILGSLFRSTNYQKNQTELVIVISAHLVVPTSEDALSLPTDRVQVPRESELFLLGRTEGGEAAAAVSLNNFIGSYGYVME